ncbi:MAG: cell division protein ZipA C-terminal FtsZ-binding domain-containing protein [Propionivibrio sp.]|nr:cell division protein ZipA C-terminal FtsZ-binding domain-containing protein [Propionivibrio sp.]
MTELQTGLIGLGVAAVIGVAAYNKWQEYRHRKLAEQVLNNHHADILLDESGVDVSGAAHAANALKADVEREAPANTAAEPSLDFKENLPAFLMPGERVEPVFHDDQQHSEPDMARQEPVVEPASSSAVLEPEPSPKVETVTDRISGMSRLPDVEKSAKDGTEYAHLLSPLIDYVAAFETVEPLPANQILDAQRAVLMRIRKPVHWIGYNEFTREWEPIIDDGDIEYRRFRIGVQLVDRQGPLDDSDLSVFHIAMQDLAADLMAIVDLPARQPALDAAAKLDAFCASVDIQIGINVISQGQAFPGTKLRALAEAAGMLADGEGHFVRSDDEGNVLFVLHNQEAQGFSVESMKTMSTHGITFLLDVPRVSHGERVFNQMVDLARRFSEALRGSLVDDNHRPLSAGALDPIRSQVGQYQSVMAEHGLPAGGPLTRRLFS